MVAKKVENNYKMQKIEIIKKLYIKKKLKNQFNLKMSGLTRSITQKILIPLHLTSLSTSGSDSKKANEKIEKKEKLLKERITKIYLGFEKIGLPIHGFTDSVFFISRIFLPSEIPIVSGKRWLHASLLLETENDYSIVVEYGGYKGEKMDDKDKDTYETYYWFEKDYGVRFAEMSYNTYKKYKLDYDSYSERIFPLQCGRNITLGQALENCNYYKRWSFKNYDLASQNCQDFAATFIRVTGAYREKGESHRGLHNLSSAVIPKCILKEIENNEDDGWNTAGKIPVVGPIIGVFYGIFSKI